MPRSVAISRPLLASVTLMAASLAVAQAPACPAANDPSLPKRAGVYIQSGHDWITLSNPRFGKLWLVPHSFLPSPPSVSDDYLLFKYTKSTNRTHVSKPLFLVRGHSRWTAATFLLMEMDAWPELRWAPVSGDALTKSKREATIHVIQEDVTCVQPSSDLSTGEYVLILYPAGPLPSKRNNFFDFGID